MRKILLPAAALVLLALIGGLWWLYGSKDALVKAAIEKFGPEITGVGVTVRAVHLEPADGKGTISGLAMGNPKGFDAPHALQLGEMRLAIDGASLTKDVIVIKEVVLQSPEITYQRADGQSNLDAIQKNVDRYVAKLSGGKKDDDGPKKKFIIENLYVRDGKVHFGTTASLPLPDVHLRDVGKKSGGASAGDVVKSAWDAILHGATNLASRAGHAIQEGAKSVIDGAKSLFK
jgi:hypothetical protein